MQQIIAAILFLFTLSSLPVSVVHGQMISAKLSANKTVAEAPLQNVALNAAITGLGEGMNYVYKFDCASDGNFEKTISKKKPKASAKKLCNYPVSGTYTARVVVDYSGNEGMGTLEATSTIVVTQPIALSFSVTPSSGEAPLRVDAEASVIGAPEGSAYQFQLDCTNDGDFDAKKSFGVDASYSATDACNYSGAGAYTARMQAKIKVDGAVIKKNTTVSVTVSAGSATSTESDANAPALSKLKIKKIKKKAAVISWMTDEPARGKVIYASTPLSGGTMKKEVANQNYLHAHSIRLSNLTASTTYYYMVESVDANGNSATSSEGTFTTSAKEVRKKVKKDEGGAVALVNAEGTSVSADIPNDALPAEGASEVAVDMASIEDENEDGWVDPPEDKTFVGDRMYDIAITEGSDEISEFDAPIELRFTWSDDQIPEGASEVNFQIGFFDDADVWQELPTTVDAQNNVAIAETLHFTRFALVASAAAITSPPASAAIFSPSAQKSSFFIWELKGGELVQLKPECAGKADLNFDNRVNLIDFSVLAFWFRQKQHPLNLDVNNDQKLNVADFSILIYCWTR